MTDTPENRGNLGKLQFYGLAAGGVALVLGLIGLFTDRPAFLTAYLCSWLFVLGIALGSLAMVMLHNLTGGEWGILVRRVHESAMLTIPLLAIAFIPIAIGYKHLYPWSSPDAFESHGLHHQAHTWFTYGFWLVRAVIYFVLWSLLAWVLAGWSLQYDRTNDPALGRRIAKVSAGGLVILILTITFAAVDWIMAREAGWFSTIIGFIIAVGQAASAMMFGVLLLEVLGRVPPLSRIMTRPLMNDLGNLMLTLVILWTYMSFAQLLIVYMGNIAHETPWYVRRGFGQIHNGWIWVGVLLLVFHFFTPFLLLLWKQSKRHLWSLTAIAGLVLLMRLIDCFWWAAPGSMQDLNNDAPMHGMYLHWTWFVMPVAFGGLWLAVFVWLLKRRPLAAAMHEEPPLTDQFGEFDTPSIG